MGSEIEYDQIYYIKNREKLIKKSKDFYEKNKEEINRRRRKLCKPRKTKEQLRMVVVLYVGGTHPN